MFVSGLVPFSRLLIVLAIPSLGWTQTAYLEPAKVFEGDITELIIEQQSKVPSLYALETSVLEKDFEVLKKSSRLYREADGDEVINRMQWRVMISPRRSGKLEVPSLVLGGKSTPSLLLDVVKPTAEMLASQKVVLQIESLPENPYVGQQTIIRQRLLHHIPVNNYRLLEPETEQVDLYRSGEESRFTLSEEGHEVEVVQRDIALFARRPGDLMLTPAIFRGEIPANVGLTSSPFRRIYRVSNSLTLQVREIPAAFSGRYWLPAIDVQLTEKWGQTGGALRVGDSISRSIKIVARGLHAEALPEDLLVSSTGQIQIYPDQVGRQNRFEAGDLIGSLGQSFVVVFTEAGEFILPEFRLSWWDVNEDVEKHATLPQRKITVKAAVADQTIVDAGLLSAMSFNHWLISGIFISVMIALFFWPRKSQSKLVASMEKYRYFNRLKKACLSQQPEQARNEILKWARAQWPDESINGLWQIHMKFASTDLNKELRQLDEALYSPRQCSWNGAKLYRLLRNKPGRIASQNALDASALPQLYPH